MAKLFMLTAALVAIFTGAAYSQEKMSITFKDGRVQSFDTDSILKIEFKSAGTLNVNGMYKARDGLMCFEQTGSYVIGRYNWAGGGKIQGTLQGVFLKGTSEDKILKKGYVNYEFAPDGSSYRHWWGDQPGPPWRDAGNSPKVAEKCSF